MALGSGPESGAPETLGQQHLISVPLVCSWLLLGLAMGKLAYIEVCILGEGRDRLSVVSDVEMRAILQGLRALGGSTPSISQGRPAHTHYARFPSGDRGDSCS